MSRPPKHATKRAPAAPYRPQPTPKVLQTKSALPTRPANAPPKAAAPRPCAPPVYRPQPEPKVLQRKQASPPPPSLPPPAAAPRTTPNAPPAYRPQPQPRVLQAKPAVGAPHANPASKGGPPPHQTKLPAAAATPLARRPCAPAPPSRAAVQMKEGPRPAPPNRPGAMRFLDVIQRLKGDGKDGQSNNNNNNNNSNNNNNNNNNNNDDEDEGSIASRITRKRKAPEPQQYKSPRLQVLHNGSNASPQSNGGSSSNNNNNTSNSNSNNNNNNNTAPTPPTGVFITQRVDLHWAPHSTKTNGMKADEYMYSNAKANSTPPEVQTNAAKNNRREYRCVKCGGYFPRKGDCRGKETKITIDHYPPMSVRLDNAPQYGISGYYCDGKTVWFGILEEEAMDCYNDPSMLQFMCSSCNSSKGGKKDYFRDEPTPDDEHDDKNCPDKKCKFKKT